MKNQTLELAKARVRRRSITPADEGRQQLVIDRLTPLGFKPETLASGEVANLLVRRGGDAALVGLTGAR
ncbi:MAG: hypothetical protein ABIR98_05995 [Usitatibacter sp.]